MDVLIFFIVAAVLITLANFLALRNRPRELLAFDILLVLLNGIILVPALVFALIPEEVIIQLGEQLDADFSNIQSSGLFLAAGALWGILVSLKPVRKVLSRVLPIKSDSPVHGLALVMAGYVLAQSVLAATQGGVDELVESLGPVSVWYVAISEIMLLFVAILGVGYLIRRPGREVLARLGLERPTLQQLLAGVGVIILLVVLQVFFSMIYLLIGGEEAQSINDANSLLLSDFDTVLEWLFLALAAGIGEELLFRGALQPVLGLWFTSLLFAVVHIQYGLSLITVLIVILALTLGLVRRYANTTVAIFVHLGYNFTLGLFALLASYLEQFSG